MGSAIEDGDLRESAAYDEARTRMFETDAAISQLERDLLDVEPGDVDSNIGRTFEITIAGVPKTVRLTDGHPRSAKSAPPDHSVRPCSTPPLDRP